MNEKPGLEPGFFCSTNLSWCQRVRFTGFPELSALAP
jgi:hypothetical protein